MTKATMSCIESALIVVTTSLRAELATHLNNRAHNYKTVCPLLEAAVTSPLKWLRIQDVELASPSNAKTALRDLLLFHRV